jgi:hypothetical protein
MKVSHILHVKSSLVLVCKNGRAGIKNHKLCILVAAAMAGRGLK